MVGKLVRCLWEDAHGSAANVTYSIDEIPHAPVQVVSYGILLREDEIGVSIASEECDSGIWRGYSFIPRKMLIRLELVKQTRTRKKLSPKPPPEDKVLL